MELKYLSMFTNAVFYEAVSHLKLVATCDKFNEYKSPALQIFVRIPVSILESGDKNIRVLAYVEPQINLTASMREGQTIYKIQITILPDFEGRFRGVKVTRCETPIDFKNFTEILKTCDTWSEGIAQLVRENGEFDFYPF